MAGRFSTPGLRTIGGLVSGSDVVFVGDAMSAVVQGVTEVRALIGQSPVIVGGLAVLCRLSRPYRATVDLDLVDRRLGTVPQLEVLRAAEGAKDQEPAAVLLPTRFGELKVDVLEVRQIELDEPSQDPGDRLHASAHAWGYETASELSIAVERLDSERIETTTLVAEPGPLIAMKLQAVMNRSADKQGTDLLDIVRLVLDDLTRPVALGQLSGVDAFHRERHLAPCRPVVRPRVQTVTALDSSGGRCGHHRRRHRSRRRAPARRLPPPLVSAPILPRSGGR